MGEEKELRRRRQFAKSPGQFGHVQKTLMLREKITLLISVILGMSRNIDDEIRLDELLR